MVLKGLKDHKALLVVPKDHKVLQAPKVHKDLKELQDHKVHRVLVPKDHKDHKG